MSACKTYEPIFRGTIIAFHGGCFTGGSIEWDKEQNEHLANLGFRVHQVDFPKTSIEFDRWCRGLDVLNLIQSSLANGKVFLLGRSSGGYLAKRFRQFHKDVVSKTIYICPVFRPFLRAELLQEFAKATKEFFQETEPLCTDEWETENELLAYSPADENVPVDCFTADQMCHGFNFGSQSHSKALKNTGEQFTQALLRFFK